MIKNNHINLTQGKKAYFISDHHFGLDAKMSSNTREKLFLEWLDQVKNKAGVIFILGDLFDYWYEYKHAVPKGFVRVLGKLAELTDAGISIYFFVGNHDMWIRDYFKKELGIQTFFHPEIFYIQNKKILLGHGDGLGPGDKNYKRLKKLFTNTIAQWLFRWLHPDIGIPIIKYFSQKNKLVSGEYNHTFHGEDKEWLYLYAKQYVEKQPDIDYFIFGHRHLPLQMKVNQKTTYFNTGDWLHYFSYLEMDDHGNIKLTYFKKDQ